MQNKKVKENSHLITEDFLQQYYANLQQIHHYDSIVSEKERLLIKKKAKKTVRNLMRLPNSQCIDSELVKTTNFDDYRIENHLIYTEPYMTVSILVMIPKHIIKAPGVMCISGSSGSKEMLCSLPELDGKKTNNKHPLHNRMAYHYVKAGYVAVALDNMGIGESKAKDSNIWSDRSEFSARMMMMGRSYVGISVHQKLCVLKWMKQQLYIDENQLVLSGHSLGVEPLLMVAHISDDIKACVYNDFIGNRLNRKIALKKGEILGGFWHEIPDFYTYFTYIDLLCYLAPTPLLFTEGGITADLDIIKNAYDKSGSGDLLQIYYYKKYQNPNNRLHEYELLPNNISLETYYEYANIDVNNHFFKEYHAIPWVNQILKYDGSKK